MNLNAASHKPLYGCGDNSAEHGEVGMHKLILYSEYLSLIENEHTCYGLNLQILQHPCKHMLGL